MTQISQSDFQLVLPVGVSAHDEVYESVAPAIDTAINNYSTMLLGDAGMRLIESADGSTPVEQYFKQLVSINAFLSVFRQLDLVLTPTGFGIVSNETLSPASKQRVDALEGQLRTALCRRLERTIEADPDIFAPYHSSEACTTAYTPAFANKKDSSAFLFNG